MARDTPVPTRPLLIRALCRQAVLLGPLLVWCVVVTLLSGPLGAQNTTFRAMPSEVRPWFQHVDPVTHVGVATPLMAYLRKLAHFGEYGLMAMLAHRWLAHSSRLRPVAVCLLAVGFCVGFAVTDEFHQSFVAGRTPLRTDVAIDGLGAIAAVAGWRLRLWRWRLRRSTGSGGRCRVSNRAAGEAQPVPKAVADAWIASRAPQTGAPTSDPSRQRMRLVQRLRRLTFTKLWVLALAFAALWLIRVSLWVVPFRLLRPAVARARRRAVSDRAPVPREWVGHVVELAAHWVPQATCLTKALAGYVLLRHFGHDGVLHLGVARDRRQGLSAHAWLECDGQVIIGGGPGEHVPLPPIGIGQ